MSTLFQDYEFSLNLLDRMAANLIESHMGELEDCHAGDAELAGIAPEACSYCRDIQEVIDLLSDAGRDVKHLTAPSDEVQS